MNTGAVTSSETLARAPRSLVFVALVVMACAVSWASYGASKSATQTQANFDAAARDYERGAFDKAALQWRQIANDDRTHGDLRLRAYLGLATACQKMGLYQEAEAALTAVKSLLKHSDDGDVAKYYQQAGNVRLAAHRHPQSLEAFSQSLTIARAAKLRDLEAAVLNDYGNALNVGGYPTDALAAYELALSIAHERGLPALARAATVNLARLHTDGGDSVAARTAVDSALTILDGEQPTYEWAMALFALADMAVADAEEQSAERSGAQVDRLHRAQTYAIETGNTRLASLAYGYEAKQLSSASDAAQSDALLRKAVFYAAQSQAPDILYQWEWLLARSLQRQGKSEPALEMFAKATATLTPIRQELLNGYHDSYAYFQRNIRPVYLDYVDALLVRGDADTDAALQRSSLNRARNILETLKSAELQDYFRDECVVAQESKAIGLDQIAASAAVLYPIVLPDRIELLLSIDGEFYQRRVAVDQTQLSETTLRFREFIQEPGGVRFLPYANRLYRWLIEPIKQQLVAAGIDTLVIVPDGILRTVPFAALHNGDRFLIEEFAVAMTPSLRLTAAPQLQTSRANALLTGVAQSVQGFAPLPQVTAELATIHDQVGGKLLSNREYTVANLRAALADGEYNIVHMATHSVVGATPGESFLLTYDGKLTMGDLDYLLRIGEFRKRPVELLTLSACETAVGDERAALGLAGIAVKSGAQSVVASLWLVDDAATAQLMNRFYRNLNLRGGSGASKVKALRAAQLNMLADPTTEHPSNWAAFMMIGNWQ